MKKLILTGWGWKDYACAAALALRHHKNAQIMGISQRRLPEFLNEVTGYGEIIILGIGLSGDPKRLEQGLEELSSVKTKVSWVSVLPMSKSISEGIRSRMDIQIAPNAESLTDAVSQIYEIPIDDLAQFLQEKKLSERAQKVHLLLDAAMYMYRNYQDEKAYANAIRHIANGHTESQWSDAEKMMVAHYKRFGSRELVGKSPAIRELIDRVNRIALKDHARVLIYGESGTGKETVALQLHNKSPRDKEPFIAFNCASVTPDLLESRFLGHEKGSFTGANERKHGIFEQASGAATHRDLAAMVRDGTFREDLFYRLNVIQIRVPPLREHKDDIAQIADGYWLRQHGQRLHPSQIEALMDYDYPGNVRELLNLLERASVLEESDFSRLLTEHKQMTASLTPQAETELPDSLEEMTRLHVRRVYDKCGQNLTKAAEALGAARNTVRKYLG